MPPAESIPVRKIVEVHPGADPVNIDARQKVFSSRIRIHTLRAMSGGKLPLLEWNRG